MATERLYYADPYLRAFTARVTGCAEDKNGWLVTTGRTAFYPEGGGQPADRGFLGGAAVLDVHERGGEVIHLCDRALAVGEEVRGELDWLRRFDHMQQHSGEHIVSGMLCARFACHNVGFHMGAESVIIDYDADIPWDALCAVEADANRYLTEDHAVEIGFYSGAALDAIDYRSKKPIPGEVRIVRFPGADCCACCGTHVAHSGEIGIVKFLSAQRFRGGTRIALLCGARALRHLTAVWDENQRTAQLLSAKPEQTHAAVAALSARLEEEKRRRAYWETLAFDAVAEKCAAQGCALLFQPAMEPDSVRRLADAAARRCGSLAAVFAGEDGHWTYALIRADGADVSALTKRLNAALTGRGGGRGGVAQGSCAAARREIESFFEQEGVV